MCGIAGFISQSISFSLTLEDVAKKMGNKIHHRGPDDQGYFIDNQLGLALIHRRLSILDLSQNGHQPMRSACERYIILFNGEIYNHNNIRREINIEENKKWRSHSDTETILEAISLWGLEKTLKKLVGMFAFALWDKKDKNLYLARDRMGEKPLYYGFQNGHFLFASEIKSIRIHPAFEGKINRFALENFFQYNFIPSPLSIYQNIFKLPPATFIKITQDDIKNQKKSRPQTYWSIEKIAEKGQSNLFSKDEKLAILEVEKLLSSSIAEQMLADVPIGTFLSGGIDSSIVTALMQQQSNQPIKTFTIGFHELEYDEAQYARAVAKYLSTDHTDLYLTHQDAEAIIPKLPHLYDEPFADVSQIPTYLVSQLAKQSVTVVLSGDGGDEFFGGYERHIRAAQIWKNFRLLPKSIRMQFSQILNYLSSYNSGFEKINSMLPYNIKQRNIGLKLQKAASLLQANSELEVYLGLLRKWSEAENIVLKTEDSDSPFVLKGSLNLLMDVPHQMMLLDSLFYLPDNVLTKVDRASMGVSLEVRAPMLDHRLAEFAWQLPLNMKIRHNKGKWILREILYKYIPKHLIERPKSGFGVPMHAWLRGALRDWAEDLLDVHKIKQEGFLNASLIQEKWKTHLSGKKDFSAELWSVLMFQSWLYSQENNPL